MRIQIYHNDMLGLTIERNATEQLIQYSLLRQNKPLRYIAIKEVTKELVTIADIKMCNCLLFDYQKLELKISNEANYIECNERELYERVIRE